MAPLLAKSPDRQFERMYRHHVGDVYRYTLAVLRNPFDAEDVTQTTFLNAYRAMQNGERPETPRNWLITIAHNVCRQRFRQQRRRPQPAPLHEDLAIEEPEDTITAEDIQRALGHLAFSQRSALVMRELEGRSYPEIAQIMGLSVSAIETLLFRARRALREQLEIGLSCAEAERFVSRQLDLALSRKERGQLRAHLRECKSCEQIARRERASRGAMKALFGAVPLPSNLLPQAGYSLGAKLATILCAGAVVGGGGFAVRAHALHVRSRFHAAAPSTIRDGRFVGRRAGASRPSAPETPAVVHLAVVRHPAAPVVSHAPSAARAAVRPVATHRGLSRTSRTSRKRAASARVPVRLPRLPPAPEVFLAIPPLETVDANPPPATTVTTAVTDTTATSTAPAPSAAASDPSAGVTAQPAAPTQTESTPSTDASPVDPAGDGKHLGHERRDGGAGEDRRGHDRNK